MLDLKALENEIKFFETLDAGISAYKMFSEGEAKSFEDGVRRFRKQIPINNNISHSHAIVAKAVMSASLVRRIFIMSIRERKNYIDFASIANTREYQELRDKLLNNNPSLTQVDCFKILRQFCNAIAHGDVIRSFNFEDFDELSRKFYKNKLAVNSAKPKVDMDLSDALNECGSLILLYESNFEIKSDGTRVKRPAPVKFKVKISPMDMNDLLQLVIANETTHDVIYYINDKLDVEELDCETNTRTKYILDDVQKDAIREIRDDYLKFAKKVPISEQDKVYNGIMIGLQKVLHGDRYVYLKIDELTDMSPALPNTQKDLNKTKQEVADHVSQFSQKILGKQLYSFKHQQRCYNAEIKNAYKNMLMTQVTNLLEEVDQNCLKVRTGKKSKILTEIATEYFEKKPEELTDKDYIMIIDNIRDAFIHGSYINLSDDRTEIYDQVSKSDKTLEHKFTIYNSDLEAIKDDCLEVFKDLRTDMIKAQQLASMSTVTKTDSNSNDKDFDK